MTPKQRVLKRWPDAYCCEADYIHAPTGKQVIRWVVHAERAYSGEGPTPAAAWRDAAERMK